MENQNIIQSKRFAILVLSGVVFLSMTLAYHIKIQNNSIELHKVYNVR